ncbi:MAG: tRNA lysidine(34) synthetase TilS [Planctomycetota bacterium]
MKAFSELKKFDLPTRFILCLEAALHEGLRRGPWIAAFSAGADSMALLRLLQITRRHSHGPKLVPEQVIAFHVNHQLRRRASMEDETFAQSRAAAMGFEFQSERLNPPGGGPPGSMEAWARRKRYAAIGELAEKTGASLVLTAHHMNDQAETVLQRLMHGSGYQGLSGIRLGRPLRIGSECYLFRPMLFCTRPEIEQFLKEEHLDFRVDESNQDLSIQRNWIRIKLMPALAGALPDTDIMEELLQISAQAQKINTTLYRAATKVVKRIRSTIPDVYAPFACLEGESPLSTRGPVLLDQAILQRTDPLLLYPILNHAAGLLVPGREFELSGKAFEAMAAWVKTGEPGPGVNLGFDIVADFAGGKLRMRRRKIRGADFKPPSPLALALPGITPLPDGSRLRADLTTDAEEAKGIRNQKRPFTQVFDADRAGDALSVRTRRPGDRFQPLGAAGAKKLKSFIIDRKVAQEARDYLALVCNEKDILWIVGLRIHHAYRVTDDTSRYLILSII